MSFTTAAWHGRTAAASERSVHPSDLLGLAAVALLRVARVPRASEWATQRESAPSGGVSQGDGASGSCRPQHAVALLVDVVVRSWHPPPTCGVEGLGRRNSVGPHELSQLLLQLVAELAELVAAQHAVAVGVGIVEAFDPRCVAWRGAARVGWAFGQRVPQVGPRRWPPSAASWSGGWRRDGSEGGGGGGRRYRSARARCPGGLRRQRC